MPSSARGLHPGAGPPGTPVDWSTVAPGGYDFTANVDPAKPHPRRSQATARVLGGGKRRPALPYNGNASFAASRYERSL